MPTPTSAPRPRLSCPDIARLEERRAARGTTDAALLAEPIAGGWMSFGGEGSWANLARALGLQGPVSAEELDRLVAFYVTRGVEPKIVVCPFVHESLLQGLAERGFVARELECVLAREIESDEDLRALLPNGWPADLEIVRVDPADDAQVRVFVDVSTSGFRPDGEPMSPELFEVERRIATRPRCDALLALVRGEPAGGGSVESGEGIAGLFGASVLPRFQRRGIQQALIVSRLERARERGCLLAAIHARPGIATERNAARLGFFMAYTSAIFTMRGDGLVPSS